MSLNRIGVVSKVVSKYNYNYCMFARKWLNTPGNTQNVNNEAERSNNQSNGANKQDWEVKFLYDGECPICKHEVNFLQKRDKECKIQFVDIADKSYDSQENGNIEYETGMKSMHVVTKDGKIFNGVDSFYQTYKQVNLGWIWTWTQYKSLHSFSTKLYNFWAKYRLKISGRPDLQIILKQRKNSNTSDKR